MEKDHSQGPKIKLNNGLVLPCFGLGTVLLGSDTPEQFEECVLSALKPPWDTEIGDKPTSNAFSRFFKRSFTRNAPPRNLTLSPPGVPESVVTLVKAVNEATANIPNWDEDT